MKVYFGVCIFLQLTLGVLAFNHRRIQQSEPQAKDLSSEIADETIQLINTGRELITSSPAHKNVVLVIGNTGAGKTTTTKFITGQLLECHPLDLQRKNEQISKNATESIGRLRQDIEKHRKEIIGKTKNVEALTNNVKEVNAQIVALEKAKKEIEEKAKRGGRINVEMMNKLVAMGNTIGNLQNDLREKEKDAKKQQKALSEQIEQLRVREEEARREAQKN